MINWNNKQRGGFFFAVFAAAVAGPFACSGPADLRTLGDPQPRVVHHSDAGHKDAGHKVDAGTPDQVCNDYSTTVCQKLDSCTQNISSVEHYSSFDECVERETITCLASLAAPDNGATLTGTEHCGAAIAVSACHDVFDHTNTPSACSARPGPRANGSLCAFNGQCASTWCYVGAYSLCGVCANRPPAGATCTVNSDCGEQGMHCSAANICEPVVTYGAACGPDALCPYDSQCVGPDAGADAARIGTCVSEGAEAGAPCDSTLTTAALCAEGSGYFCPSATKQCAPTAYVLPSESCGVTAGMRIPDGGPDARTPSMLTRCGSGGQCVAETPTSKAESCVGPAAEGELCDVALGPPCLSPARCVLSTETSTAGICTILGVTVQCN